MTHTLFKITTTLTLGEIYSFRWRSHNLIGYSDYSELATVSLIDAPVGVTGIAVDRVQSDSSSLHYTWTLTTDGPLAGGKITGYEL